MRASFERRIGLSVIEVLVALALLATSAVLVGVIAQRGDDAHLHARELARVLSSQRWRAVMLGAPVSIGKRDSSSVAVVEGRFTCDTLLEASGRTVTLTHTRVTSIWPLHALAFAPDGRARACNGGGVGSASIVIEDRAGGLAAVVVSALGRVRWEPR